MKNSNSNSIQDLNPLISLAKTRRTKIFAYGFIFTFIACTAFLAFNPSNNTSSPWFSNLFSSSSFQKSLTPYKSQVSSIISQFFPNSTTRSGDTENGGDGSPKNEILGGRSGKNGDIKANGSEIGDKYAKNEVLKAKNQTGDEDKAKGSGVLKDGNVKNGALKGNNETKSVNESEENVVKEEREVKNGTVGAKKLAKTEATESNLVKNETTDANKSTKSVVPDLKQKETGSLNKKENDDSGLKQGENESVSENKSKEIGISKLKQTENATVSVNKSKESKDSEELKQAKNEVDSHNKRNQDSKEKETAKISKKKSEKWIEDMMKCDIFQGHWVKDDSYPLYPEGSCPHIDEPFDCYLNGRQNRSYQKMRWQPDGCNIPRLNATDMLERLRNRRLVFVGDSLNRNMWESLVCVLRNSVKDKTKVFEASGKREFRTEGSYSFLFKDYGATIEFFRSPFLVQEWEMHSGNKTKETLRLDIIEKSSDKYKDAHVLIFNTGHWWTHEKTSKGKDYYQEGNRVYGELNVVEAFHKALNTWARWIDANVNPKKSMVFFRGYSASHFSGGQWNSGGACDREVEPIKDDKYLRPYPPKSSVLEDVLKKMKTPVSYLNITRMTDYRKDAHPSVYRKQSLTDEERRNPLMFQDCSHWCLPGVPDSWNELVYAKLIISQYQMGY